MPKLIRLWKYYIKLHTCTWCLLLLLCFLSILVKCSSFPKKALARKLVSELQTPSMAIGQYGNPFSFSLSDFVDFLPKFISQLIIPSCTRTHLCSARCFWTERNEQKTNRERKKKNALPSIQFSIHVLSFMHAEVHRRECGGSVENSIKTIKSFCMKIRRLFIFELFMGSRGNCSAGIHTSITGISPHSFHRLLCVKIFAVVVVVILVFGNSLWSSLNTPDYHLRFRLLLSRFSPLSKHLSPR